MLAAFTTMRIQWLMLARRLCAYSRFVNSIKKSDCSNLRRIFHLHYSQVTNESPIRAQSDASIRDNYIHINFKF